MSSERVGRGLLADVQEEGLDDVSLAEAELNRLRSQIFRSTLCIQLRILSTNHRT